MLRRQKVILIVAYAMNEETLGGIPKEDKDIAVGRININIEERKLSDP